MKKLLLFVFVLLVLFNTKTYSYDTTAAKYMPLQVGNVWTYNYFNYPYGPIYRHRMKITGTINLNNHQYYIISSNSYGNNPVISYYRIDSVKTSLMQYDSLGCQWLQHEFALDSLTAHLADSSKFRCTNYYRLADTSNVTVFAMSKKSKNFYWTDYFEGNNRRVFVKDIGLYSISSYTPAGNVSDNLIGCVINGVLYGDTSLTGINQISSNIPDKFSLSQNYPNPFNPSTVIKFQVAGDRFVKLIIYDALGKEVSTLVNEQLKPGVYEADFDGTNLPSGVYFYKLDAGEYIQTKKMVLIK